ncbi:MAG: SDR family oxidoreductase [Mycobacteriaceae bacterium]|nr:SDR family oxidoreductase [Mycobacteriaceae bacterium]
MPDPRSVVITGASRGLGFASATYLYAQGWRVVAAMRSPDNGLEHLRAAAGAGADDPRLIGVQLDLVDAASVAAAAKAIEEAVGAPDVLIHNAGIAAAGCVEDVPMDVWEQMFATHVFGPVALTRALLPSMRAAGRGRIVVISSQGGVRGMPLIGAYSAAKGAVERWAEALANEIAPFGLGVTVIVTGTFDTDIITDAGAQDYRNFDGPYRPAYVESDRRGRFAMRFANDPERFARRLAGLLDDKAPFARHAIGPDARMLLAGNRILPARALHHVTRLAMGIPGRGALIDDPNSMTLHQRSLVLAARVLPVPLLKRLTRFSRRHDAPTERKHHG